MGRKRSPGLYKRGKTYHIDKVVRGIRINESSRSSDLDEAEKYLAKRVEEIRSASIYGKRPDHTFSEAATRYLKENIHRKSIADDASRLKGLLPFIGNKLLAEIHDDAMRAYVEDLRGKGRKSKTVNNGLEVVRRILKKAASKWRDELTGKTWISGIPLIENVDWGDARKPYPISWIEQKYLLAAMPEHIAEPSLFGLHTGCREGEICSLKWEWEVEIPEGSVFVLPEWVTKNGEERVVVINAVARSILEAQRRKHPTRVFTYPGRGKDKGTRFPLQTIYNSAWKSGRERAADLYEQEMHENAPWGFRHLRVHDLRHTFGRRLRAANVAKETRSALLGHKTGDITTHYSEAEIQELIDAVGKIAGSNPRNSPALTLIRAVSRQ